MERKLNKELGCYIPSFFEMHVDTDKDDLTPNKLPLKDATVLFHEYIHFLQDISTYYGLRNIYIYGEYFRSVVNRIISSGKKAFSVPYQITDNKDNVLLNIQTHKITQGDSCNITSFTIKSIDRIEDDLISNPILPSIPSIFINTEDDETVSFGAMAIMESMAYLMERLCSPKGVVPSPDFPYWSAEIVSDYYVPGFSCNPEMVLALCDMSLQSSNPGHCFVKVLEGIKKGDISFYKPEDIYDYFYSLQATVTSQGEYTMLDAYETLLNTVKGSLHSYFNLNGQDRAYHNWVDIIADFSIQWRKKRPYYLLDMARQNDLMVNGAWGYAIYNVGTPLMRNNNNNFYKIPPHGCTSGEDVEYFKALGQVESLFSCAQTQCEMLSFCSNDLSNVDIDENCKKSPWNRCDQERLCPYALIWRHWGLSGYYPE